MKSWWLGILTFALVGAAGYLTRDFDPANPGVIWAGSGTYVALNDTSVFAGETKRWPRARYKALVDPKAVLDRLLTDAQGSLEAQLGADSVPEPRVPTAAEAALADKTCRDRMREIGIIPSGSCADIGDVVDNLATGKYRFNKPTSAILGEPFQIRLTMQTAEAEPVTFDGLPGAVQERTGKLAQDVEATLSDDDFEITPSGPQARTFTRSEPVEWNWRLKPKSAGAKTLTIEVVARVQVGPDKHPVQIKTLHEPILIQVTMFQRLKAFVADASGMVVAAAAIATPLAVLIGFIPKIRNFFKDELARFRRRRASE